MESSASTPLEIPNEENSSIVSNPEASKELQCSEKVSESDVEIKREITTKTKRVSFHFGSNTNNDDKDVVLSTIQNIYDSKTDETSLVRNNSTKSRINKSAYIKLHRHSFSSTGNSSVDKLKGKYEYIAKQQTDNNLKANIVTRAKANTDKSSTNDVKNSFESDKQTEGEHEKGNAQNLKSTEVLKLEFINSSKSEPKEEPTRSTITSEKETKSCENLLLKTTSNIEKLQNNLSTKLSSDTIEKLRTKYSPASYGYPRETSSSKITKKVQFKEQPTKIPIPTPRVSVKQEKEETESKLNQEPKENVDENLNEKEIQAVTVKLVSVPEPAGKIESIDVPKDENSNTIVSDDSTPSEIKPKKPAIPIKPKLPGRIPETVPEQSNEDQLQQITGIEVEVTYDNIEFAEPEDKHFIERHSSSEDSVDKLESFFSEIVMDKKPKEKKRSNSFKRMLTGGLFGRDKKKSEEDKSKHKKKDNAIFADNAQNESQAFDRNSSLRHTIDNSLPRRDSRGNNTYHSNQSSGPGPLYYYSPPPQLRKPVDDASFRNRYTEMKGSFISNNHPTYSPEDYVPMDNGNLSKTEIPQRTYMNVNKYIDTSSSSSNTLESENRNCTYQNALIAQAEMRQLRENENLHRNSQKSGIPLNVNRKNSPGFQENRYLNIEKLSNSPEMFRDTPQDSMQNLQLVKPKALIPINSERPLPNPYRNNQDKIDTVDNYETYDDKTLDRNLNVENLKPYPHKNNLYARTNNVTGKMNNRPVVEEIYGTVFDSITPQNSTQANLEYLRTRSLSPEQSLRSSSNRSSPSCKSPTSPRSLEASKLKLPHNREKIELQPRLKSPIPQARISTDKIIATELLRKTSPVPEKSTKLQTSPIRSPAYQGTTLYENTPENQSNRSLMTSPKAHSTPQGASQSNSDYVCLRKKPPTSPKEDPHVGRFLPRQASAAECLEAAEWQRQQRELDKSPALESPQQITTDVVVHVDPEEQYITKNSYSSPSSTLRQRSPVNQMHFYQQPQQLSPRSAFSAHNNVRPQTPLQQSIPSPNSKSPDKQHMLQNVEAFYWRELRKLKDKEEQDLLRYRQQQLHVYGYVEDPVLTRRSRSVSPSAQRGRRSLSLPRDSRPVPNTTGRPIYTGPEIIPEGRPVIAKKPIQLPTESTYGQVRQPLPRNLNFIRNTFERSTIGPIGTNRHPQLYENYYPKQGYLPIFKRGSLTTNVPISDTQSQASKKVSFSNRPNSNNQQGWPTKNGFTRSPPTRRVDREGSMDDEVFLPNTPKTPQNKNAEDRYAYYANMPQNSQQQQIYQNASARDPIYVSRIPKTETDYPERRVQEGLYGRTGSKQTTVSNKVCDIYGQIHEANMSPKKPGLVPQNYGQIKQTGFMYGQLQQNPNVTVGRSFNHLNSPTQNNFVRGTRLTASVNDMYRRYPNERARYVVDPRYQTKVIYIGEKVIDAPNRPLPPLPERKDTGGLVKKNVSGYVPISDTESGSEAGEVQRILQSGVRQKNFSVIGK